MIWCEHCRDHFEEDHYPDGSHAAGLQFGPTGRTMVIESAVQALMADDVGSPTWYEAYKILRMYAEAAQ